jgi:hypothetical protein
MAEVGGGIALQIPKLAFLAAAGVFLVLIAIFPANAFAAKSADALCVRCSRASPSKSSFRRLGHLRSSPFERPDSENARGCTFKNARGSPSWIGPRPR